MNKKLLLAEIDHLRGKVVELPKPTRKTRQKPAGGQIQLALFEFKVVK